MSSKVLEIIKGLRSSIGPPEVIKSFWKVLQCSERIRSSILQKVLNRSTKSTKSQENAQKVHKVLAVPRFSGDPQNVLNFLKRFSKPSKSSEVCKRYSKRPQIPQKVINVLKILWSSKVPQMVIKWSSQSPQKFLKTVRKRSTRIHEKVLKSSSIFCDLQVHRSSKSPQKVHEVPERSGKCTKRSPTSSDLRFSTDPQITQKVLKVLEFLKGPQEILKSSTMSSNIYQRPQFLSR